MTTTSSFILKAIFIVILAFGSCTSKDNGKLSSEQYPQKWRLVKMSGQMANSETTGNDMQWQEHYLLHADGTFVKTRDRNGEVSSESGTYEYQDLSDGRYLVLNYKADNPLIGNCTNDLQETLAIQPDGTLLSTWAACDGPGLEYKLMEG